jgi:hypothetical protein
LDNVLRRSILRNLTIILTSVLVFDLIACHAGEPLDLVKSSADRATAILKDPKLKSPDKKQERIERLKEAVNPIFDYEEMARRSLGAHWRRRTLAEQEEFAKLFRAFFGKSILGENRPLRWGEGRFWAGNVRPGLRPGGVDRDQRKRRTAIGSLSLETHRWKVESLRRSGRKHQYRQQLSLAVRAGDFQIVLRRAKENAEGEDRVMEPSV